MNADEIRKGDHIEWCGRVVTVLKTEHGTGPSWKKADVYLTVEGEDVTPPRRLHYFASEDPKFVPTWDPETP